MGLEGVGDRNRKIAGRVVRAQAEIDDDILDHDGNLLTTGRRQ